MNRGQSHCRIKIKLEMALSTPNVNKTAPIFHPCQSLRLIAAAVHKPLPIAPTIQSPLPAAFNIKPTINPIQRSVFVFLMRRPSFHSFDRFLDHYKRPAALMKIRQCDRAFNFFKVCQISAIVRRLFQKSASSFLRGCKPVDAASIGGHW